MATKINPHGEAALDPTNYVCVGFYDNRPDFKAAGSVPAIKWMMEEAKHWRAELRARSTSVWSPTGQCAHCGNAIRYHVLYEDERDGALVAIGQDCAEHRLDRSPAEWKAFKDKLDLMREKARAGEKRIALRMEYPEAVAILEDCIDNFDADRFPDFVSDIAWKMDRYGDLSDKQAAAVVKYTKLHRERVEARKAEKAAASPLPAFEGRVELELEVLSVQWRDNAYGGSLKMLAKHEDGWKLWGTLPAALPEDCEGKTVRFVARVERSKDDETFGFFSRPTKAEVVA